MSPDRRCSPTDCAPSSSCEGFGHPGFFQTGSRKNVPFTMRFSTVRDHLSSSFVIDNKKLFLFPMFSPYLLTETSASGVGKFNSVSSMCLGRDRPPAIHETVLVRDRAHTTLQRCFLNPVAQSFSPGNHCSGDSLTFPDDRDVRRWHTALR